MSILGNASLAYSTQQRQLETAGEGCGRGQVSGSSLQGLGMMWLGGFLDGLVQPNPADVSLLALLSFKSLRTVEGKSETGSRVITMLSV